MASEIKIYCKNLEEYVEIRGGESMLEVSRRLKSRLGFDPICVTVNNKVRTLRFEVFAPVQVEFFDASSRLGDRVYILSLCMMEDTDDDDDRLLDGDVMRFEVRAIDKLSYDYLFSMQQTSSVSTNPIANFSGGCLGYFSAYGKTNYSITFRSDEVEEE